MLQWFRTSLPARAGLAVILVAALAFASACSAVIIALISEDDAAAMNVAGSLRMTTYRINWQLEAGADDATLAQLAQDMQARLDNRALLHMVAVDSRSPAEQEFQQIRNHWQQQLLPALQQRNREAFAEGTEPFMLRIERFVSQLQQQSERRQGWQQSIQGAALLITAVVLLISMFGLHSSVLEPIQDIVRAAERFRAGDLQARVSYRSPDELGQLAQSFNAMADAIEESHRTLADRVAEKTLSLEQANDALALLYRSSSSVASTPLNADRLDELVGDFQQRLPGLRLNLCLKGDIKQPVEHLIAMQGDDNREICTRNNCATCERHQSASGLTFAIRSQGRSLGELSAHYLDGHAPRSWERELIQALADLIGTALSLECQREKDNRLLLFDERTIIARELHDSLAQALSYMKMQVSRLQTLIRRESDPEQLVQVSEELRKGLNNAYRQLRELLTTFRLKIHEGGLEQALGETTREFADRGQMQVQFDSAPLAFALSASEQIHLLQITREALSNCVRHARASRATVQLRQRGDRMTLLIEDNGVGITPGFDIRQHHGMNIMQERARSLNGELHVSSSDGQGTRIQLSFCPEFLRQHQEEITQ
ncbi:HAMP domain-containing protein [Halopseudomonas maritima]|uniref:HAMP domain-containing protein n=1 Tax=Halopseudomonas maritima TaxID=2918528 RepID=UPI001EEA9E55|nr:HAMP domain-containing protein [Halopseudomonas maritima]UJJ32752.1 HAMP domain-containing protein [Halopseudomonas maritima]